ncbi:MAG TPA: glycoside hydrolase family 97 protein [Calditrichia bacterium]|nr:glycoside hydrolase family 97 protein [Calditrichia bacterium]
MIQRIKGPVLFLPGLLVLVLLWSCGSTADPTAVYSPNGRIKVGFLMTGDNQAAYKVYLDGKTVIDASTLGFDFRDAPSLAGGLRLNDAAKRAFDETWEMVWGEQRLVRNHYNELRLDLQENAAPQRRFFLTFRVYDDGLGFRFEFPEQEGWTEAVIMDENTQFNLTADHQVWWIPGDWDIYEHLYNTTAFSEIDAISKRDHPNLAQTYIPENAVNTPVTMKTADGIYLSFHEANLTDYSDMTLKIDAENLLMQSELVGSRDGAKVKRSLPFNTPWRTLQIAEKAGELIESKLIVNLNEPNKLEDVSWIQPAKYVGIWWEMHLAKSSWDMASGKHGATTANAKRHIDFAAANSIDAVLIEGWNTGWEHWIGFDDREGVFDFVTPYPDYDLEEVVRYGKENGVEIIMHHETSAAPRTYEQQLDTAFALCRRLGIHAVKTGYVGPIIPKGEYHHGQWMVNHYRKVLETAAQYQVMVNAHEPIKATGIRRTLPNAISREGLRGQEFNSWSEEGGNPTEHLAIVPFTRMLAGPIDFTPGIFDMKLQKYGRKQINTTLAQQLALYVVIYSPIQMAADLIENYDNQPAFQFIRDVALDWQETRVLNGEIGQYVTIARKERNGERWFLGSLSNEEARQFAVSLDFLDPGKTYTATLYGDGADAHWNDNPTAIEISTREVNSRQALDVRLAPGGGLAISFVER